MVTINLTYFDNNNVDFDAYKADFIEFRSDLGEDTTNVTDEDVWDYISTCHEIEWEDFLHLLKRSPYNDVECVIAGTIGRWNGRFQIEPTVCNGLETAVMKTISGCEFFKIAQINGHLEVTATDHDGTSYFEIHLLSEKGQQAHERISDGYGSADLSRRCYHKAMKGTLL